MKKIQIFEILLFFLTTSHAQETQCPQTKCLLEDSVCLTKQAQERLPAFAKGFPELGIPAMDNLSIDPVVANFDKFIFNWTDIKVEGLKDAIIDKVSVNMELKTLRLLFHTDLFMEYSYSVDGVVLSTLPVYGSGKGDLTIKRIVVELLLLFDIIKNKHGKDVMDIKTYYYGYCATDIVFIHLENLYNGDKRKSNQFHKLLNENYRIMMLHFSKFFQTKISGKIFDAVKIYMCSRPLEELALYNDNN